MLTLVIGIFETIREMFVGPRKFLCKHEAEADTTIKVVVGEEVRIYRYLLKRRHKGKCLCPSCFAAKAKPCDNCGRTLFVGAAVALYETEKGTAIYCMTCGLMKPGAIRAFITITKDGEIDFFKPDTKHQIDAFENAIKPTIERVS